MTPSAEERLREAVAAVQLTPAETWSTVTATARVLARAIKDGNLDECERAARYIADVSRHLRRG